jgi:hypothetical protein
MRSKLFLAVTVAALLAAGAAFAGSATATRDAGGKGILYSFLGQLTARPGGGHVSITVEGGNRAALRAMLGHPVAQTFDYGDATEFLKWANGVPKVVRPGDLDAGDYVWIHVRAPRGSPLDAIEDTDAGLVGDHGTEINPPSKPLYLFRGKLTAAGSSSITVARGHRRRGGGRADEQGVRPARLLPRASGNRALAGAAARPRLGHDLPGRHAHG